MSTNDSSHLHIEWDDMYSAETDSYVQQLKAAQAAPLVRAVGDTKDAKPAWYRGQIVQMTLAGLVGGLVAWALIEIIMRPDLVASADEATARNIVSTVVVGFAIGLVIAVWEGISARSMAKVGRTLVWAVPSLALTTVIGGVAANALYTAWMESVVDRLMSRAIALDWSEEELLQAFSSAAHMPRGVAWAVVGLAAGTGIGLASRQAQRMLNGALGGVVGGFVGGAVFDFFTSGMAARAVGLAVTGLAVGLGIGLVEVARRQHWLEIMAGGMAGKQFILYSARTTVGAAADNDVTLIKDPGIAARHAILASSDRGITASAADPTAPLLVNGAPISPQRLTDGDVLQLGSTMLRYRDKAEQPIAPGAIAG